MTRYKKEVCRIENKSKDSVSQLKTGYSNCQTKMFGSCSNEENTLKHIISSSLNPFLANEPFLYPLKIPGNQRFSGDIKMEHWPEMN